MVSGMRNHVLGLACLRHGLPSAEGRGIDRLPPELRAALAGGVGALAGRRRTPTNLRRPDGRADRRSRSCRCCSARTIDWALEGTGGLGGACENSSALARARILDE